jgi:hypothetical protein
MRVISLVLLLIVVAQATPAAATQLTYADLVKRLTDLEGLAVLPLAGEKCGQWSSYERASRYDAQAGKYVDWDANGDGRGVIREEGDVSVIAEMQGPGCIFRIWSAAPKDGHVRIYLDGKAEPVVDLPFRGYFDLKNPPFIYPALVHDASSGKNCYIPIPYQRSCKIVAEKNWGNYYHITYATFPEGTIVPTFRRDLGPEEEAALAAADMFLGARLGTDPAGERVGQRIEAKKITIGPGRTAFIAKLEGPRAITSLSVRINQSALSDPPAGGSAALREVVLRILWDGEKTPSVWAPLGDFFGTAPGINYYLSLPLGMIEDGPRSANPQARFYSFWYMPFAKQALVEMANEGRQTVPLEITITHAPLSRPADELGRFHAKWHRDAFLPAEPERAIDWTMVKTSGRGRFCGVMLHVWNPRGGWWGEGDEKFFVDGEKFPSTFGTGSEDYFGYAWGNPTLFEHAFHNQTLCENGNAGHVSVNRWHIPDNVPFQSSFEGSIEKYFPNGRPTLYACTAYWYLAPRGDDPYSPVPAAERTGFYQFSRPTVRGALEGERLKALEVSGGNVQTQAMGGFGDSWSGDAQLWWTGAKPGDRLILAVPVREAGTYELKAQLTKANDYGVVQFWMDGAKIGAPVDLYNPSVVPSGVLSLGKVTLTAGEHRLGVEITGANEQEIKAYMFGLDYLMLLHPNPARP